ncbi:hypothetical protein BDZ94DRAFT_1254175 [Collybia nuda]|uniref:DUF6533 domain-containing protein n=1 Tax=Collybia nuda TaxID=64659 RepID=A0A9P5Y821_9AGAR|nr:hypothetical protein BDZ94DRAFT_1254175 [Collybia nuda]
MSASIEDISKILASSWLSNYFYVSGFTLLIIDWLSTLDTEIKYIWNGNWGLGKALFLLTRYPIFAERMLGTYDRMSHSIPASLCPRLLIAINCKSR